MYGIVVWARRLGLAALAVPATFALAVADEVPTRAAQAGSFGRIVQAAPAAPAEFDLDLQVIDIADGIYAPGDAITVFTQVQNVGTATAPPYIISYYLSADSTITEADAYLGTITNNPSLAPGQIDPFNATGMSIPSPLASGAYHVGAVVETADTEPANNINLDPTPITVSTDPDILVRPAAITVTNAAAAAPVPDEVTSGRAPAITAVDSLDALEVLAERHGRIDVIVGLDAPFRPEGHLAAAARQAQRAAIGAAQDRLVADFQALGAAVNRRFQTIPYVALRADAHALRALAIHPSVLNIAEDRLAKPVMDSSNPVIGSPLAWADGWDGSGQAVAVLDTGVDGTHPWLAGKVVSEACYSSNIPDLAESLCPGGVTNSVAPGSGANCAGVSGCDHGTHVAGTVAGNDGIGPRFGVARGGDLIAMQVFTRYTSAGTCDGAPPCLLSRSSDQIAALERVLALSGSIDIAAVNMSLGGGQFFDQGSCDAANAAQKAAIDNLWSVGIVTAIASGNDGYRTSMGFPGCISTAVAVGATTDADQVASFSNVAGFIDLLAPGVSITSSIPGGGTAPFNGTSMATPHVAGAFAVLRQFAPAADPADLLAALVATGTPVDDNRVDGSITGMPRINIDLALQELGVLPASLAIINEGPGALEVTSIASDQAAPWLSFDPPAPFQVPSGQMRVVDVLVDFGAAPPGTTMLGIAIESDDPDESPWPGGVALTVVNQGGNTPPVANPQSLDVVEDGSLLISLTGSDGDTDPLTFAVSTPPAHGDLNPVGGNPDGSQWTYVPDADYYGADAFSFVANDGSVDSTAAAVDIDVLAQNDPPTFGTLGNQNWPAGESGFKSTAGWIAGLSLGPANEVGQSLLDYQVGVIADPDGVLSAIDVGNDGALQYTLTGASGQASFSVMAQDDGGTANGGDDLSTAAVALIEVAAPAYLLSGTVATDTEQPLEGVVVEVFDSGGSAVCCGGVTDAAGQWSQAIPQPGTYYLRTASGTSPGWLPEIWDDIPCDGCDPAATGTPIEVSDGDVGGIDFRLGPVSDLLHQDGFENPE